MTAPLPPPERRLARRVLSWIQARPLSSLVLLVVVVAVLWSVIGAMRGPAVDRALVATVRRGDLSLHLRETGVLRPAQSLTYYSPLGGRDVAIVFLAPEGAHVGEGDLLARLDTTQLHVELDRATQARREMEIQLQLAEAERQEAIANLESVSDGEGAISEDEARVSVAMTEKKVARLRAEYEGLQPLLEKGFITREELDRAAFELEQAENDLKLARRKAEVLLQRTRPRDRERAKVQVAQRASQLANARARLAEAVTVEKMLRQAIDAASIYARRPGLVVYEDYLAASPRRKVRVGDRVTATQGIVTIPEVRRMLIDSSVREADVHRVRPELPVTIRIDAFPALGLTGRIMTVGTLARSSVDQRYDEKRFDLVVEVASTDADLRPEMTARIDILVGERRQVLLVPVNAVFDHDGALVANVIHGSRIEARPLELGAGDETYAEVLGGLTEGDQVTLIDIAAQAPPSSLPAPTSPESAGAPRRR